MKKNGSKIRISAEVMIILLCGCLGCGVMALVDGLWQPGYWIKSGIKAVLFLLLPLCATALGAKETWKRLPMLFCPQKKILLRAAGLGLGVAALILGGYFALRGWLDFSAITGALGESVGVRGDNFIWVALYISLVNSLLEEFFFRGFLFLGLREGAPRWVAYTISAALFAIYHGAMMIGWGSIALMLLLFGGLFAGGLIFNWLNERSRSIWPSWLVHLCSNLAINTIGFILFAAQ